MSAGIDHARGDYVALVHADLQDPPELLPGVVEPGRHRDLHPEVARELDEHGRAGPPPSSSISAAEPSVEPSSTKTSSCGIPASAALDPACSSGRPSPRRARGSRPTPWGRSNPGGIVCSRGVVSQRAATLSAVAAGARRWRGAGYALLAAAVRRPRCCPGPRCRPPTTCGRSRRGPPSARRACATSAPTTRWPTRSCSSSRSCSLHARAAAGRAAVEPAHRGRAAVPGQQPVGALLAVLLAGARAAVLVVARADRRR